MGAMPPDSPQTPIRGRGYGAPPQTPPPRRFAPTAPRSGPSALYRPPNQKSWIHPWAHPPSENPGYANVYFISSSSVSSIIITVWASLTYLLILNGPMAEKWPRLYYSILHAVVAVRADCSTVFSCLNNRTGAI